VLELGVVHIRFVAPGTDMHTKAAENTWDGDHAEETELLMANQTEEDTLGGIHDSLLRLPWHLGRGFLVSLSSDMMSKLHDLPAAV
jgi:hypothetical protein